LRAFYFTTFSKAEKLCKPKNIFENVKLEEQYAEYYCSNEEPAHKKLLLRIWSKLGKTDLNDCNY
jgi:hypothetical protein